MEGFGDVSGLIIVGQYKAIAAQNGFNRRIFDEFQEAQDNQFLRFLALKFHFLRSGTPKIGSGRSNLYIGRWSRACLTPLRALYNLIIASYYPIIISPAYKVLMKRTVGRSDGRPDGRLDGRSVLKVLP